MSATPLTNRILQRLSFATLLLSILVFHPESAAACSVCFSATEEARNAYYLTTALMMAVPVLLLAGIGFWLYRSFAKQKAHELAAVAACAAPEPKASLQE